MLHWPQNLKRFGSLEDFAMSDDRRGLGRGLDDLMAQNEMDLPFLSAYGPAFTDHLSRSSLVSFKDRVVCSCSWF